MLTPRTPRLTASRNGFLARSTALSWPWNKDRFRASPGTLPPTFADLTLGVVDCRKPVIRVWCKDPMHREEESRQQEGGKKDETNKFSPCGLGPRSGPGAGEGVESPPNPALPLPLREGVGGGVATTPNPALPLPLREGAGGGVATTPDLDHSTPPPNPLPQGEGENLSPTPREDPVQPERTGPLRNGNPRGNPNLAPRCGARTRRTGCPCRAPAMRNGRCRLHGGKSTGPRTEEGRARIRAARTRHGRYSAESRAFQSNITSLFRRSRKLLSLARQPGPVDIEALRHLLPPESNKHPVQRGTTLQRPVPQRSGPNPPPPKDHMQREQPVAGPQAATPRAQPRGSAFTVVSTHRPTSASVEKVHAT